MAEFAGAAARESEGSCSEGTRPLLSICIPTYNRAFLLRSTLHSLCEPVRAAGDAVEVIVSDNASPEETAAVVREMQEQLPIRYYRNEENLGFAGNLSRLFGDLARGEFVWAIGDDDLMRPDGIRRVLDVLRAHPEVDYVFVNTSPKAWEERGDPERLVSGSDFPELRPATAKSLDDRPVERWEELVDPSVDWPFAGAIICSVIRREQWRSHAPRLAAGDDPLGSLGTVFPHSVVMARALPGRPAYYVGYPCTISFFYGGFDWPTSARAVFVLCRLQELLDLYLSLGIDPARVERCRGALLRQSDWSFATSLFGRRGPLRDFRPGQFLWRNRKHPLGLVRLLLMTPVVWIWTGIFLRLPRPIPDAIRAVKARLDRLFCREAG